MLKWMVFRNANTNYMDEEILLNGKLKQIIVPRDPCTQAVVTLPNHCLCHTPYRKIVSDCKICVIELSLSVPTSRLKGNAFSLNDTFEVE